VGWPSGETPPITWPVWARTNSGLARFSAVDLRPQVLPVQGFRPGSVARTPGMVVREGEDRFLVLFGWAVGAYVWETVADAGAHVGGAPVGLDALDEVAIGVAPVREEASRA